MSDDAYQLMRDARKRGEESNRETVYKLIDEIGIENRVKFVNCGTLILDDYVYYYIQKRKYRLKGHQEYKHIGNFISFVRRFAGLKKGTA